MYRPVVGRVGEVNVARHALGRKQSALRFSALRRAAPGIAPDQPFVAARQWRRFGVTEELRSFLLRAYKVSVGELLLPSIDTTVLSNATAVVTGEENVRDLLRSRRLSGLPSPRCER